MFNIGMPELLMILVIALVVLGPKRLPEIAKSLARAINEFKKATDDIKESFEKEARSIRDEALDAAKIDLTAKPEPSKMPYPEKVEKPGSGSPETAENKENIKKD